MNRNVWLLSLCQALLMTGNILLISVIALIGKQIAPSSSMITLPVALQFLGLMSATIPASLIMGKLGRRLGFSSVTSLVFLVLRWRLTHCHNKTSLFFVLLPFCWVLASVLALYIGSLPLKYVMNLQGIEQFLYRWLVAYWRLY